MEQEQQPVITKEAIESATKKKPLEEMLQYMLTPEAFASLLKKKCTVGEYQKIALETLESLTASIDNGVVSEDGSVNNLLPADNYDDVLPVEDPVEEEPVKGDVEVYLGKQVLLRKDVIRFAQKYVDFQTIDGVAYSLPLSEYEANIEVKTLK